MSKFPDPVNNKTFAELFDHTVSNKEMQLTKNTNELTGLFREMLSDLRLRLMEWETLTNRYYGYIYGGDKKEIAQAKINLTRALVKDELTWSRFVEALIILGYDEYEISVSMRNRDQEKAHTFTKKIRNPLRKRK